MANRSYLYSIDAPPRSNPQSREIMGLHEWGWSIPISHRLLASGSPRISHSIIWDKEDKIAITSDFELGYTAFLDFFEALDAPEIRGELEAARAFLEKTHNRKPFIQLECGEIFDMNKTPVVKQNELLLTELQSIKTYTTQTISALKEASSQSKAERQKVLSELGLGCWSNTLYYDLNSEKPTTIPFEIMQRLQTHTTLTVPLLCLRAPKPLNLGSVHSLPIGRKSSIHAVSKACAGDRIIGLGIQRDPALPTVGDLSLLEPVGAAGYILESEGPNDDGLMFCKVIVAKKAQLLRMADNDGELEADLQLISPA